MIQVTILGCGSSLGVPVIGCNCSVCKSTSPYNKRTRSSIFINNGDSNVLIDFGFDIKDQLIREGITRLDAAILTHDHADHVSGIDNLRVFPLIQEKPLDIFTDSNTGQIIENRYKYLFNHNKLIIKPVDFFAKLKIGSLTIQLFKQYHGPINSLGLRIGDFIYSSDVNDFPEESKSFLYNSKVWILDCLDYKSNGAHAGLDKILLWNQQYQPKQIFLTNMRHTINYHKIVKELPDNIAPLYDGFKFTI